MRSLFLCAFVLACRAVAAPTAPPPREPAHVDLRGLTVGVDVFTVKGDGPGNGLAGIAEDLSTSLAAFTGVSLVEVSQIGKLIDEIKLQRTTGLVADDRMAEIGSMLGVDVMVAGSAVVRGDQVRLNARLVIVETKRVMTGLSVTGPRDQLFRLEDELARAIAVRIDAELQ